MKRTWLGILISVVLAAAAPPLYSGVYTEELQAYGLGHLHLEPYCRLDVQGLRRFLEAQFVEGLGLLRASLRSYPDNVTVWIASDNLLAAYALAVLGSPIAEKVFRVLMANFSMGLNGVHEILVGIPGDGYAKPDRTVLLGEVLVGGLRLYIKKTVFAGGPMRNWWLYADRIVYAALSKLMSGDRAAAYVLFRRLLSLWDGHGFRDEATPSGVYDTYKVVLALYLLRALESAGVEVSEAPILRDRWCRIVEELQSGSGGIYTKYVYTEQRILPAHGSDPNVETTAMAVLALLSSFPEDIGRRASSPSTPVIAVYYYPWYREGLGSRHWNDSALTPVVDKPIVGFYSSLDPATVEWQLRMAVMAGVNTLFVSWWGPGSYEDRALPIVFEKARSLGLRVAVLIEPYLGGAPQLYTWRWWVGVLSYLWTHYVARYPDAYALLNGRPLVLAFNPVGLVYRPEAPFAEIRIVGNAVNSSGRVDWDLWPDYLAGIRHVASVELRIRKDGYVAVAPRFDDTLLYALGARQDCSSRLLDPLYLDELYEKQWLWIIEHRSEVRIVAIYSWNEYHERSAIEPHWDPVTHRDRLTFCTQPVAMLRSLEEVLKEVRGVLSSSISGWVLRKELVEVAARSRLGGAAGPFGPYSNPQRGRLNFRGLTSPGVARPLWPGRAADTPSVGQGY